MLLVNNLRYDLSSEFWSILYKALKNSVIKNAPQSGKGDLILTFDHTFAVIVN